MTDEEKRIAIAEACGYTKRSGVTKYDGSDISWTVWDKDGQTFNDLPDFLNDLNAMNKAEGFLSGLDWARYFGLIQASGAASGVRATAPQRADVFLQTLNLLKP